MREWDGLDAELRCENQGHDLIPTFDDYGVEPTGLYCDFCERAWTVQPAGEPWP